MKKYLLAAISIAFFTSLAVAQTPRFYSNTIDANYWDGQLYLKLKNDVNYVIPAYDDQYPIVPLAFLPLIQQYDIYSIQKAFKHLKSTELDRTYRILFNNIEMADQLIRDLEEMDITDYAERIPVRRAGLTPNDPNIAAQYALNNISAYNAWDISTGSYNIKVAIVDDAVKITHQDISANKWVNPDEIAGNGADDDGNGYDDDINGYDVGDDDEDPNPPSSASDFSFSHGTHCAGIADASSNNGLGVASIGFGLSLMAVKCNPNNAGNPDLIYEANAGVEYAMAAGADVISMSWGGGGFSQSEQNMFNYGWDQGIVFCAAAGNDGGDVTQYPAQYNHVLAVGSTGPTDEISSFSNYGNWVHVMAPGENIYSTVATSNSSYEYYDGTSMSCPMVAGLCGLIKATNPTLTNEDIVNCLLNTCDNIDSENPNFLGLIGTGRINAFYAVQCAAGNASPIAVFEVNTNFTCTGTISFTDISVLQPTQWFWDFGDGSTSTQQNPTHTYVTSGLFDITLIATNGNGSDTLFLPAYISITLPDAPTGVGDTSCISQSFTLNALGSGSLYWYDAPAGGNNVGTGTSYTTPLLNSTTNYYVEDHVPGISGTLGPVSNTIGGGGNYTVNTDRFLIFDAYQPFKLVTVKVYASGNGNRTIRLKDAADNIIKDTVINISNGTQTITINFDIPQGLNMQIGVLAVANLYRNSSGANYPFSFPGVCSITGNSAAAAGYYYFLYDWHIQLTDCISARTLIPAVVGSGTSPVITPAGPIDLCEGESVVLTSSGTGPWLWSNGETTQAINATATGNYFVTAYDATCGMNIQSASVAVNFLQLPVSAFTYSNVTQTITFANASQNATSWYWSFGDGGSSVLEDPIHTFYNGSLSQTITLISSNGFCNDTLEEIICVPFTALTQGGNYEKCVGEVVPLSAINGTSWLWSNGETTQSISVTDSGSYSVQVSDAFCGPYSSNVATVDFHSYPTASFTPTINGWSVQFSNTSVGATSYDWFFGDGGTSSFNSTNHVYTASGVYTVTLIACTFNCCDTAMQQITVGNVGIDEADDFDVLLFPNPTEGVLNIVINGIKPGSNLSIELVNTIGQEIKIPVSALSGSNYSLDMSNLNAGMYWMQLTIGNERRMYSLMKIN